MAYRLIAPIFGKREMGASKTLKKAEFDANFAEKIAPKVYQFHLERFKAFVDSAVNFTGSNVSDLSASWLISFGRYGEYRIGGDDIPGYTHALTTPAVEWPVSHGGVMFLNGLTGAFFPTDDDIPRYDILIDANAVDSEGVPVNFFVQDLNNRLTSSGGASLFFLSGLEDMLDTLYRDSVLGPKAMTKAMFDYLGKGKGKTSNEVKHLLDGTYLAKSSEKKKFVNIVVELHTFNAFNGEFFQAWYELTSDNVGETLHADFEAAAVAADAGLNRDNVNQRIKTFLQEATTHLAGESVGPRYHRVQLTELGLAEFVRYNDYLDDDGDEDLPDFEGDYEDLMSGWTMDDTDEDTTGEVEFNKTTGWGDGEERRFRATIPHLPISLGFSGPMPPNTLFVFEEEEEDDDDDEEDESVDVRDGSIPLHRLKAFYGAFLNIALLADIRSQAEKKLNFERFGKGDMLVRYTNAKYGLPGNEGDYKSKKKQKKKPPPDTLLEYLAEIRTDFFVKWVGVQHGIEKRQWEEFFKGDMIDREIQWYNSSISSRFTVAQFEAPPEDVTSPVAERAIERILPPAYVTPYRTSAPIGPLSFERITLNKRLDSPTLRLIAREYNADYYRYIIANVRRLTEIQIRKETTGKKGKRAAAFKSPIDLYDKIWDYLEGVIISVVGNPDVGAHGLWERLFRLEKAQHIVGFMPADWYGRVSELDLIRDPRTIGQSSNTDRNAALMKELIQHLKNTQFRNESLLSGILTEVENSKLDSITELSELSEYMTSRLKSDQKRYYRKDGNARVDYYPAYSRYIAICRMLLTLPTAVLSETLATERQRVMAMAAAATSTDTTQERMEEAMEVGRPIPPTKLRPHPQSPEDTVRINPLRPTW